MSYVTPLESVLQALRAAGCEPSQNGHPSSYQSRCPAHDDAKPSLSIAAGNDGKVLIRCHAGCDLEAICQSLGLKTRDLFPPRERKAAKRDGWATLNDVVSWLERKHPGDRVTCHKYHDMEGPLVGVVFRIDHVAGGKTVRPMRLNPAGSWEFGAMPAPRPLYNLPALLAAPTDQIVFVAEGEKCVDALRQIGLLATTSAGGSQSARKTDWSALAGRRVIILPDADEAGNKYARDVLKLVRKAGADARVLDLARCCPTLPEGGDIADVLDDPNWCGLPLGDGATPADFAAWLQARAEELLSGIDQAAHATGDAVDELSDEELAALADDAAEAAEEEAVKKPRILITCDQHQVITKMLELLPLDDALFDRGGVLSILNRLKLIPATPELLAERFTSLATFAKVRRRGDVEELVRAHPPRWGVKAILDRQFWPGVRQVRGVINWPLINSDGRVVTSSYDSESNVLIVDAPAVDVPTRCTEQDAVKAAEKLLDVIHDFPFLGIEGKAAWLAIVLTLLTRYAHHGNVPMFVVEGNSQGVGKSLLLDVAATMVMGKPFPRAIFASDSDEMRKKITTLALAGQPAVLFDNVIHTLRGDALAAALTGSEWYDRLLGTNRAFNGSLDVVMLATSNGATYDADLARRVLPIRLHSPEEFPEKRTGFRYPRIIEHVRQHRAELLGAALTVLKAWCDAGQPEQQLPSFGSFEDWSRWVRQPLVWLGFPDPLLTRAELVEATPERAIVAGIIRCACDIFGDCEKFTASDLIAQSATPTGQARTTLRELLTELLGEKPSPKALGRKLRPWTNRTINGLNLRSIRGHGGKLEYYVRQA